MPNGDPGFDVQELNNWFQPIQLAIEEFADKRNLLLDKCLDDSPSWSLRFLHPNGGEAGIYLMRDRKTADRVHLSSCWRLDCYEEFTRSMHFGVYDSVDRKPDAVIDALEKVLKTVLGLGTTEWHRVAHGYESEWGMYSKVEWHSMRPTLPEPKLD